MKDPTVIKLQGYEFRLKFTMDAWERLENEVCPLDDLQAKLGGEGRLRTITKVASIMAEPAAEPDALFRLMEPRDVRAMTAAIMAAITEALKMEEEPDGGQAHDVVLEEIDAKKNEAN